MTGPPSMRLRVEPNDEFLRDERGRAWLLRGVNLSGSCKFPKYPQPIPSHLRGPAFLRPRKPEVSHDRGISTDGVSSGNAESNEKDLVKENGNGGADGNATAYSKPAASDSNTSRNNRDNLEEGHISFVGRPFELDDATEHLARLRHWGFRMIRWVITWEAIEHKGPGQYDEEFLEYTVKALLKAKQGGFKIMIDFHQDVWSRFSGGSGAPLWTLYAAGLDPHHFAQTGAAVVHNTLPNPETEPMLRMVWLTNYYKLACATMFTLFYAGKILAPKCTFEGGINIQDYLQNHFLGSINALVEKIHATPGLEDDVVIGYDSWNEPSCGWIGLEQLDVLPEEHDMRQGGMPTPFQSMMLGMSKRVTDVAVYRLKIVGPVKTGSRTIDPHFSHPKAPKLPPWTLSLSSDLLRRKVKAWLEEEPRNQYDLKYGIRRDDDFPKAGACLWAQHGVWSMDERKILQQDYFARGPYSTDSNGVAQRPEKIRWVEDHWLRFAEKVIQVVRKTHTTAILFLEPPVYVPPPDIVHRDSENMVTESATKSLTTNMVYAPHHYDDVALLTKKYLWWINLDILGLSRGRHKSLASSLVFGKKATESLFGSQISDIKKECHDRLGKRPILIGETGLHFDVGLDNTQQAGNIRAQTQGNSSSRSLFSWGSKASSQSVNRRSKQFQQAFDNILNGLDRTLVHYTLWNYTIENDQLHGDGWNGENLSLYCKGHTESSSGGKWDNFPLDLDVGGRAIEQFCRPYPIATVGTPLEIEFDRHEVVFKLRTVSDSTLTSLGAEEETEIYIPWYHFGGPECCTVTVSDGSTRWPGQDLRPGGLPIELLHWRYGNEKDHWIEVRRTR
ncbi:hypothetical protein EMPS_01521 [Entomortierella parvispora]|uniref:Glycoside hydrolase family 5 domain-containing protein n=1 Tax=Entomortierella parvispora TaxID=205924 RepID=A0A9P3LT15_9FUNG|nr:hypothetical protein EMPS_01521 [Entomortierella parvispora]